MEELRAAIHSINNDYTGLCGITILAAHFSDDSNYLSVFD